MRPLLLSSGNVLLSSDEPAGHDASMRPLLLSSGNEEALEGHQRLCHASMRPLLLSSGNAHGLRSDSWCARRFNEAAASQQRKYNRAIGSARTVEVASMRPLLLSSGN